MPGHGLVAAAFDGPRDAMLPKWLGRGIYDRERVKHGTCALRAPATLGLAKPEREVL
jgi:hypothetical protein